MTAFLVVLVVLMVGSIWWACYGRPARHRRAVDRYHAQVYGTAPFRLSRARRRALARLRPGPPGS